MHDPSGRKITSMNGLWLHLWYEHGIKLDHAISSGPGKQHPVKHRG